MGEKRRELLYKKSLQSKRSFFLQNFKWGDRKTDESITTFREKEEVSCQFFKIIK